MKNHEAFALPNSVTQMLVTTFLSTISILPMFKIPETIFNLDGWKKRYRDRTSGIVSFDFLPSKLKPLWTLRILDQTLIIWWTPIFFFWIISCGTKFPSYIWIHCITPGFFFKIWISTIIMVFSKETSNIWWMRYVTWPFLTCKTTNRRILISCIKNPCGIDCCQNFNRIQNTKFWSISAFWSISSFSRVKSYLW